MARQIERYQSYVRVCGDGRYEVFPLPTYHGPFVMWSDVAPILEEADRAATNSRQPAIALADLMEILHKRLPEMVYREVWSDVEARQQQAGG